MQIEAVPFNWPLGGNLKKENTALLIIDMQNDFCSDDGAMACGGINIEPTKAIIPQIKRLLEAAREQGIKVIHTREGFKEDGSNLYELKKLYSEWTGSEIGSESKLGKFFTMGYKNFDTIDELYPIHGEYVVDKPGTGAFTETNLEKYLLVNGIRNLIVTGVTTDCCVNSTMREATDRGFHTVMVKDCTATGNPEHQKMFEDYVETGIIFCATTTSDRVLNWMQ